MNTLNDELSRVSRPCPHDAGRELAVPSTLLPNNRSFFAAVLTLLEKRSLWSAGARCDEPTVLLKWRRNEPPAVFSNSEEIKERLLVMLPLKQLCVCVCSLAVFMPCIHIMGLVKPWHTKLSRHGSYRYDYSWKGDLCFFLCWSFYLSFQTCWWASVFCSVSLTLPSNLHRHAEDRVHNLPNCWNWEEKLRMWGLASLDFLLILPVNRKGTMRACVLGRFSGSVVSDSLRPHGL